MNEITTQEEIEVRSQEVQEVISNVPPGLVRWGLGVLFSVMMILILTTLFIQYPDLLQAKVIITTSTPPVTLVARTSGHLILLKKENTFAKEGDIIGYLKTNAMPSAILDLESKLTLGKNIPLPLGSLGELEQDYGVYLNASVDLQAFCEIKSFDRQVQQLRKQETTALKLQAALKNQLDLARQELALARDKFKIDSMLHAQKVTATVDYNKDKATWMQQQRAYSNAEMALVNNEIQLDLLSKQITDLEVQKIEQQRKLETAVRNSYQSLHAHIAKWKETYLFIAPMEGRVACLGFRENEMFIEAGKPVLSVLPVQEQLVARAELPLHNSGKVKEGQRVNIRLENYPFEQYGMITGTVSSISSMPNEDKYFIHINLPEGLKTSQHHVLTFKQQLSGTTEIITEDLKLMDRFFYQFRKLTSAR